MRASIFAGLVGIVLVLLLLLVFYRRLTGLIVLGLIVWGMLIYSAAALISQWTNYALDAGRRHRHHRVDRRHGRQLRRLLRAA